MRVGLVELPATQLIDSAGRNWTATRRNAPLVSKQVLMAHALSGEFDVDLVNMNHGDEEEQYGIAQWKGQIFTKLTKGRRLLDIDPDAYDLWALTVNYLQERDLACRLIAHLASLGRRVVVGGSDAIFNSEIYLAAGANGVVTDKSGAANLPLLEHFAGAGSPDSLHGVILQGGTRIPNRIPPMSPEQWPLPSVAVAQACMGTTSWEGSLPESLLPIGSVFPDIGCDRNCDFCQTPLYRVGYKRMSVDTVLKWLDVQKEAGAKSIMIPSDQFLGRVLWPEGREEVLGIMQGARDRRLPVIWGNGLELRKATVGRGLPGGDLSPDLELIHALWGWNGVAGCCQAYIPAERPVIGEKCYSKLLPWKQHSDLMCEIVRAGLPVINYGVIIGLPDDTHATLVRLEEAIIELQQRLKSLNNQLIFRVMPFAIRPLPGTRQSEAMRASELLRVRDPAIAGSLWTASCDTLHLGYEQISDWQVRLALLADNEEDWQGITSGRSTSDGAERIAL